MTSSDPLRLALLRTALVGACLAAMAVPLRADAPQITHASATPAAMGWRIDVTLLHPDSGWDHYADRWQVEAEDGTVLGQRILHHPHVDEQPFTRSLSGVLVPDGTQRIFIRAGCSVHGLAETRKPVDLIR
ncbi:hypothetical protein [Litorivita sp. NS0012-18]|uniref:hypothetical protein n=1 Tax=Litorivita sp. NS0012-18 TaxID=3127655 RepID=UPI003105BA6B